MTGNKNRKRGKRAERKVAKLLGGERIGLLGRDDVRAGRFSIEVKSRKAFMPLKWIDQADRNCKKGVPIVIVHVTGKKHSEDIVLMKFSVFKEVTREDYLLSGS